MPTGAYFLREQLRARTVVAMLVAIPVLFVVVSADVLSEFASALGGSVAGASAAALGAGWAAAFLAGALGYFQIASSHDADRRLSLAGLAPVKLVVARIAASLVLGLVVSSLAFLTLLLRTGVAHPAHAFAAILLFAIIYIGIGTIVGSFISEPLEGSLAVAFVFLIDAFSGPGMSDGGGLARLMPTREAADLLIAAGGGRYSPAGDWLVVLAVALAALVVSALAFWLSARSRRR